MKKNKKQYGRKITAAPSGFEYTSLGPCCILCGGAPDFTAVYEPGDPRLTWDRKGNRRRIVYSICECCIRIPDSAAHCEEAIHKRLRFPHPGEHLQFKEN